MKLVEYKSIAAEISAEIAAVLEKRGLKMKPFGARIDERLGIVRMTIEAVDVNHKSADGQATTPEAEFYKLNAAFVGLQAEWLGQPFWMGGVQYKIVGMRKRSEKCILIQRMDNATKTFVLTPARASQCWLNPPRQTVA